MPPHSYYPLLIAILRRTLAQLEGELGTADDTALLELKASIMRVLARIEGPKPEDQPAA
jgi:hypothetical protein